MQRNVQNGPKFTQKLIFNMKYANKKKNEFSKDMNYINFGQCTNVDIWNRNEYCILC